MPDHVQVIIGQNRKFMPLFHTAFLPLIGKLISNADREQP